MSENNVYISYKDQYIWTTTGHKELLLLLILQQCKLPEFHPEGLLLHDRLLKGLSLHFSLTLDDILTDAAVAAQLEKILLHIDESIRQSTKKTRYDWRQQLFSIFLASQANIDKRTAGRTLQQLPDIAAPSVTTLLQQVRRLIKGQYIFETITSTTTEQLCGTWQSVNVKDTPQYDINFNMLDDISPQKEPITLSVYAADNVFRIFIEIPVYNWATRKKETLDWITIDVTTENGCLVLHRPGRPVQLIPILKLGTDYFETFFFRTYIRFERIQP